MPGKRENKPNLAKRLPLPVGIALVIAFALSCGWLSIVIMSNFPILAQATPQESVFSSSIFPQRNTEENNAETLRQAPSHIYRNMMDDESQETYDAIEKGMREHSDKIALPHGSEGAWQIAEAVLLDNPDIFWAGSGGYVTSSSSSSNLVLNCTFTEDEAQQALPRYRECARHIAESPGDDLSKMMRILDTCSAASHASMSYEEDTQNIPGVLDKKASYCMGYAKAACFMARECGIPCVVVQGSACQFGLPSGNHAWVAAYIDGKLRYFDPYWYDSDIPGAMGWRWANVESDDAAFLESHVDSSSVALPERIS